MLEIDYYVFGSSPFAYLGHALFHEIAARHGLKINYKPIDIMGVWENSGSVPLAQRTPLRRRYRRIELQRIADFRGLPIDVDPKFFPVDPKLADLCTIALVQMGADPKDFLLRAHRCVWVDGEDLGDPGNVARFLTETGHDAEKVMGHAGGEEAEAIHARNTGDARAADAVGAPVYVYRGEPFWGQDRLEMLDHMISSGREPFTP